MADILTGRFVQYHVYWKDSPGLLTFDSHYFVILVVVDDNNNNNND